MRVFTYAYPGGINTKSAESIPSTPESSPDAFEFSPPGIQTEEIGRQATAAVDPVTGPQSRPRWTSDGWKRAVGGLSSGRSDSAQPREVHALPLHCRPAGAGFPG